jgi:GNAT superfamily N-acetyltransferase
MTGRRVFSTRLATKEDDPFLYEMFISSRERELGPLPLETRSLIAQQQYRLHQTGVEAEFPDARRMIVLAPSAGGEDEPAGMIVIAERTGELWVVDMALRPDCRNSGLGAALLASLMEDCRQSGRTMRGSVTPYNPARRLYARLGIREIGGTGGYIALEWRPE